MSFYQYLVKRIGYLTVTLFLVSVITFAITNILPGDVALLILGPSADPQSLHQLRVQLGLNQPLYAQYVDWIVGLLHGDMGTSLYFGDPVAQLIAIRLPRSFLLAAAATVIAIVLALPLGVIASVKQNEIPDFLATSFGFIGISIPIFLWGLLFILVFAVIFNLFPTGGYVSPMKDPVGAFMHLVLPATAMGFALTAYIMRMTRSSMLEVLSEDYIRFARAKGMTQRVTILKHGLRNAIIPVITVIAFQFSYAFGGVVVLEAVFYYPGIGQLTLTAIQNRDIPLLQGCIIVIALIFMISNLVADILYAYVDPRIRYGGAE